MSIPQFYEEADFGSGNNGIGASKTVFYEKTDALNARRSVPFGF